MTRAAAWAARAAAPWVTLGVLSALLTGCGAAPPRLGPTGVDELTIPTPSPDAADFAGHAANPWFPLVPGTRWTYREESATSIRTVLAEVLRTRRAVAGIETTPVRWQVRSGGAFHTVMVRWYAVDESGDVWWLGQRIDPQERPIDRLATRSFVAGQDGAQAGLVLAAAPRDGDGYLNARQPHVVERRSTVLSLTGTVATPARTYYDTVVTRDLSTLDPVHTVQTFFARGVGMVAQQDTSSLSTTLALVRVRRG